MPVTLAAPSTRLWLLPSTASIAASRIPCRGQPASPAGRSALRRRDSGRNPRSNPLPSAPRAIMSAYPQSSTVAPRADPVLAAHGSG